MSPTVAAAGPCRAIPRVWFHHLPGPDGRPFQDNEIQTIHRLYGLASHLRP